jgi:hypothetical protein
LHCYPRDFIHGYWAKADAKIEYQKKIEDFRTKKEALEEKMDELKSAGGEAWQGIKAGVEKAASDLLNALDKVKSSMHYSFSEK